MSFQFRNLYHLLRIASIARPHALIEESALHRIARQSERCAEVLARGLVPPAAKLKLAQCRGVERICGKGVAVDNRADLFEPTLGTLVRR